MEIFKVGSRPQKKASSDYFHNKNIIKFINSKPDVDVYKFWFTKHFWLDKGRKENFFDVFPEYADMKEELLAKQ